MKKIVALTVLLVLCAAADARGRRRHRTYGTHYTQSSTPYVASQAVVQPKTASVAPQVCPNCPKVIEYLPAKRYHADVLEEVNANRASRGLRPYIRDEGLVLAARGAAEYRARLRIRGHVMEGRGDFGFLPVGTTAAAAGCGALEPSWGFQACAVYDDFTYAVAATVKGEDGLLYHQLFVR